MSIQIIEIRQFQGPATVELSGVGVPEIVEVRQGPAGVNGPNSVTSATTSDGTAELSLASLEAGSRDGLPILNMDGEEVAVIGRDNSNDGESGTITGVQFGFQTKASGNYSFAHGAGTIASGDYSYASGANTVASGAYAHAEGAESVASGQLSHAEGANTLASGSNSHAQGSNTIASGLNSHAGGLSTVASGDASYAYGTNAKAIHDGASVESDSEAADVESTTTDEKTFRFANGYRFLGGAVTIEDTLNCDHIHGNLAGSVYAHVRAGENLAKGDPVYVSGSHGSGATLIPVVSKADASNAAKMPAVGVMDAAVSNNQNGHMVITGTITELDTNAYPINTVLYVATGGGWTSTPPAANSQAVAIVERSNTNNGAVIVKVNGLASSGGNGAADANKLVRYNSTGGASLTGGTLTDMTYAGTAAFTSTTRPTSAGTGTPAATSLITRADGDARYGQFIALYKNADTVRTAANVYSLDPDLQTPVENNAVYHFEFYARGVTGVNAGISTAAQALIGPNCSWSQMFYERAGFESDYKPSILSPLTSPQVFAMSASANAISRVTGTFKTSASGTFGFQWGNNNAGGGNSIIEAGSYLILTRIA